MNVYTLSVVGRYFGWRRYFRKTKVIRIRGTRGGRLCIIGRESRELRWPNICCRYNNEKDLEKLIEQTNRNFKVGIGRTCRIWVSGRELVQQYIGDNDYPFPTFPTSVFLIIQGRLDSFFEEPPPPSSSRTVRLSPKTGSPSSSL